MALENASKADENARRAELRLAEGLISQADALSLAGRFAEAHALYTEAYDKFAELKAPLIAAEVGLWSSYHQTTFPLLSFTGHAGVVWQRRHRTGRPNRLSGSDDKTLKLWELATGRGAAHLHRPHSDRVSSVAIAPDGRTALSGSQDKTLKLWDLASGKELRTFTGHSEEVNSVAIAPDGRTALSGSEDKTLKLWDLASRKGAAHLHRALRRRVTSVAIAPDGRTALSGSGDKTLKLWDLASGKELRTFTGHSDRVWQRRHRPGRPNRALGEWGQDAEALGSGQRKGAAHLHRALRSGDRRRHRPGRPNRALGERGQAR